MGRVEPSGGFSVQVIIVWINFTLKELIDHQKQAKHKKIIYDYQLLLENEKLEKAQREAKEAEEKANLEKFKCTECGSQLKNKISLTQHMQIHNKDNDCPACGKFFARRNQLVNHMENKHSNKKKKSNNKIKNENKTVTKVSCLECSKEFSHMNNMRAHYRRIHEGKTFDCQQCDKKFSTAQAQNSHVKAQHGDGKPFQCNTCKTRFSFQQGLYRHLKSKTHEKVAGKN